MDREQWLDSADPRRAAAAWHAAIDSDALSEGERLAFADWLRKSPAHVEEYIRLSAVREQMRDPDIFEGVSLEDLRARIAAGNVEPLGAMSGEGAGASEAVGSRRRRARRFTLAASVLLLFGLGWTAWRAGLVSHVWPGTSTYATAVGEQRSVVLADGSIAELNTRSALRVQFSAGAREIVLEEGEALFRVAKEAKRPFRVRSGEMTVQAVGTEFTVRREADRTTVTVLEGRVSVAPSPTDKSPGPGSVVSSAERSVGVELDAGQRVALASGARLTAQSIERVDAAAAVAWKSRRLVFDDLRLDAVVAEFNRYNRRQIRLEGAHLQTRSITGVFNANDPDSFVSFLQGSQKVSVQRMDSGDLLVRADATQNDRAGNL